MNKNLKKLLLLLPFFIPLQIYLVAFWLPNFLNYSGGIKNLDSRFSYNSDYVTNLFTTLGNQGREYYLLGTIVDIFYAILMALIVFTLFQLIIGKRIKFRFLKRIATLIPLIYLVSDLIENIGIFMNIYTFPMSAGTLIGVFSIFTTIKQLLTMVSLFYTLILLLVRLKKN